MRLGVLFVVFSDRAASTESGVRHISAIMRTMMAMVAAMHIGRAVSILLCVCSNSVCIFSMLYWVLFVLYLCGLFFVWFRCVVPFVSLLSHAAQQTTVEFGHKDDNDEHTHQTHWTPCTHTHTHAGERMLPSVPRCVVVVWLLVGV